MSMCTFGPKLEYLVYILMFADILRTNNKLYVCQLHSYFCKGIHHIYDLIEMTDSTGDSEVPITFNQSYGNLIN